jgi:hypothetical protein
METQSFQRAGANYPTIGSVAWRDDINSNIYGIETRRYYRSDTSYDVKAGNSEVKFILSFL